MGAEHYSLRRHALVCERHFGSFELSFTVCCGDFIGTWSNSFQRSSGLAVLPYKTERWVSAGNFSLDFCDWLVIVAVGIFQDNDVEVPGRGFFDHIYPFIGSTYPHCSVEVNDDTIRELAGVVVCGAESFEVFLFGGKYGDAF